MLSRWFAAADRDVEKFSAWLQRLGPSGVVVLAIMVFGTYAAFDLVRFVMAH